MMLLHNDKQQLAHWHWEIARFLEQCLALKLRSDAMIAPISQGVNFLGYITRPHYRLVRHRVVNNLNQKLAAFESGYIRGQGSSTHGQSLQALRSCMASYLGYFHHASSQRLIASLWQKWPWLGLLLDYQQGQLRSLWLPTRVTGYSSQVRFFRKRFPHARVVIQRGCETDAFEPWFLRHAIDTALPALCKGVRQINVVEAGFLKGDLKRRVIHSFYFEPGVRLCRNC
ncbi:hypothetical protein [Thiolapillus sp.]|nr:hypothetical protein [Thiolapillus sp.]